MVLILFSLQTPSQADDIRDFQIEGISIGDSLLDYVNKEQIEQKKITDYKSKTFSRIDVVLPNLEIYENIQLHFKTKDKKYIIYSMSGGIFYINQSIKNCYEKQKEVVNELKDVFKNNATYKDYGTSKHEADPTGESTTDEIYFYIKKGGHVIVACWNWSEKLTKKLGWSDHLKVGVYNKEIANWFTNDAY